MKDSPAGVRAGELGRVERLVLVRAFASWAALPQRDLEVLASIGVARVLPSGSRLSEEGAPLRELVMVVEGELALTRRGRAAGRVGPRGIVAPVHVLARDPVGYACVATTHTRVLCFAAEDLEDVFDDHAAVLIAMVRGLARHALTQRRDAGAFAGTDVAHELGTAPARALHFVERIQRLLACSELGAPSIDGIAVLASLAREVRHRAGERLWSVGDPSGSLVALVSGQLACTAADGQRTVQGPGAIAGFVDLLAGEERFYDATAVGDVVSLVIDRDTLFDVWEDHPELGIEVLRTLARASVALDDHRAH